ncbi:MAG: peptide ABC transporter substrate-binding protein [Verrucomicrobia bacterium]|nr:peptide ABC transporter substrate-binding protein [Verrucomicrobiota bacterium]
MWARLLLLVGLLLGACARRETLVQSGIRDQILYRGNSTEPESLDPHLVRGAVEWTLVGSLFEGLVVPDQTTLEPQPGVAERWTISPDGLTYVFHLRAGAKWSNGAPVTAQDFLYSARRLLAPKLGAAHAENNLFFVRNARDYQAGKLADFAAVGVRAPDAQTIEFILERPAPFFLSALYLFFPVPQPVLEKFAAMDDRRNRWIRPGNFVGNGPFQLKSWRANQGVVLERNPQYWDAANVRLRAVHFSPIESPVVEENAFRSGLLHMTSFVPLNKISVYQQEQPGILHTVDDRGIYFYSLNVATPPLNDMRVRQALSLAIDRAALVQNVIKGGKRAATHFTPPGMGGYTPPALVRFDPAEARGRLASAGFPGGRGFPTLELMIDSREAHVVIAEAIQQMWQRHLGITVRLRNQETQVLNAAKRTMDFQIVRGSWNATTYQDPTYFLGAWQTGGLYNESKWSNADFDRLIEQTWTADRTARDAAFRQAEEILLSELPAIPLYFSTQVILVHPSVKGWVPRPFADRRLKHIWLEPTPAR